MTHSTVQLLAETGAFIPSAESLMDDARELDLHYIPARYPNGLPGGYPHSFYGEKTARTALRCAERIIEAVFGYYGQKNFILEH
jgi:HEPN domain-containing protein